VSPFNEPPVERTNGVSGDRRKRRRDFPWKLRADEEARRRVLRREGKLEGTRQCKGAAWERFTCKSQPYFCQRKL